MIRGGTSEWWVFDNQDGLETGVASAPLLLAAYNAADPRQIDGVGGASSTTSKAAIVRRSAEPGIDIEYAFAPVGIGDEHVEWASNCGNCPAAVAPARGADARRNPRAPPQRHHPDSGAYGPRRGHGGGAGHRRARCAGP